jgi:predicted ATP-grasp superfamily ATP-dependent carboligase
MSAVGALVIGGDYRGLGIVRSLGRRGIEVWVAQCGDALAGYSRYARGRLRWPDGAESEQTDFLLRVADAKGWGGWVLFPTAEDTAWLVARNHRALGARYRLTTSPWDEYRCAADKRVAYERARAQGIDTPRTWHPSGIEEVARLAIDLPVIVKPAVRITRNELTDAKAWRVDSRDELLARYAQACTLLPAGWVMIQEVIPGGGEHQLAFAATCRDGETLGWVAARRGRQFPTDFGRFSTFVETIHHPELVRAGQRLVADLRLTGLIEIEFKEDPRDGRLKLLDVNARAWGWHAVGRAAGVDFAHLAWRAAKGERIPPTQGRAGVRWVWLTTDLPISARELLAGRLRLRAYLRSLRPPIEGAIAASDDPLPLILDAPLLAMRLLRRRRRGRATSSASSMPGTDRPSEDPTGGRPPVEPIDRGAA